MDKLQVLWFQSNTWHLKSLRCLILCFHFSGLDCFSDWCSRCLHIYIIINVAPFFWLSCFTWSDDALTVLPFRQLSAILLYLKFRKFRENAILRFEQWFSEINDSSNSETKTDWFRHFHQSRKMRKCVNFVILAEILAILCENRQLRQTSTEQPLNS